MKVYRDNMSKNYVTQAVKNFMKHQVQHCVNKEVKLKRWKPKQETTQACPSCKNEMMDLFGYHLVNSNSDR